MAQVSSSARPVAAQIEAELSAYNAAFYELDNLTAIIDVNRLGQTRETMVGWDLDRYVRRAEAFEPTNALTAVEPLCPEALRVLEAEVQEAFAKHDQMAPDLTGAV